MQGFDSVTQQKTAHKVLDMYFHAQREHSTKFNVFSVGRRECLVRIEAELASG